MVDIDGGLLLSGNTLYVVSYQGRLAGLDAQSGQVLWRREASSYVGVAEALVMLMSVWQMVLLKALMSVQLRPCGAIKRYSVVKYPHPQCFQAMLL